MNKVLVVTMADGSTFEASAHFTPRPAASAGVGLTPDYLAQDKLRDILAASPSVSSVREEPARG